MVEPSHSEARVWAEGLAADPQLAGKWNVNLARCYLSLSASEARLRKTAAAFETNLSSYCDGPERDALREALRLSLTASPVDGN